MWLKPLGFSLCYLIQHIFHIPTLLWAFWKYKKTLMVFPRQMLFGKKSQILPNVLLFAQWFLKKTHLISSKIFWSRNFCFQWIHMKSPLRKSNGLPRITQLTRISVCTWVWTHTNCSISQQLTKRKLIWSGLFLSVVNLYFFLYLLSITLFF